MRKIEDPKVINLYAHGVNDEDGKNYGIVFYSYDKNGKEIERYITNPKEFDALLKKESKIWKNKKEGDDISIVLHSCASGRTTSDDNTFINNVSKDKLFENTTIIAPQDNVAVDKNGTELGPIRKETHEYGIWTQRRNGNIETNYYGDTKVGTKQFTNSAWYRFKQKLKVYF